MLEDLARDGAGGDAACRLARRGAPAAAIVADAVFGPIGVVGVARAELVLDLAVILRALILVLDQQLIGVPVVWPSNTPDRIRTSSAFAALRGEARLAGPAAVEPGLDIGFRQRNAGRRAIDDAADRRPVALAPGREAEQMAEAVVRQASVLRIVVLQHRPDLRHRIGAHHADDVIAAIDVMHLAGDALGQIAQQIEPGAADLLDRDVALQGRVQLVPAQDVAEIADARGGQRLDRPGGDRVDADALPPRSAAR